MPNVAGKKPVLYNYGAYVTSGPKDEFTLSWYCAAGWLLSESEKEITISLSTLETRTYARKHDLPRRWYKVRHKHPKGMPLPGYYKEVDFGELCKKYLQAGRAERKSALDYFTRGGGLGGVRAALFAYWAHPLRDLQRPAPA